MKNRWTLDEEKTVLDEAARLLRHDPIMTMGDALYQGQRLIREERRKEFFTPHYKRALVGRVETLVEHQLKNKTPKQYPLTLDPTKQAQPEPVAAPKPPTPAEQVEKLFDLFANHLANLLVARIAPEVTDTVAKRVQEALWQAIGTARPNGNGHNHAAVAAAPGTIEIIEQPNRKATKLPAKFTKHKVCIIGMMDKQMHETKSRFPHLEFRFISGGAPSHVAEATAKACEGTYVMIKGSSHSVRAKLPNGCVNINGSQSELYRTLEKRFPKNTSMEPEHAH